MLPRAKKSFGQNFLADQNIVKRIIKAAEVKPGDRVLEIGPGTGVLTDALIEAGAIVTAIEADHDLIEPLKEIFGDKLNLIEGDALNTPASLLPVAPYKLVANIPYNITSPIIECFLTTEPYPTSMTLMVQREVADRITAESPNMSLLAVACQVYAKVKKVFNVSREVFRPVPKVDSAIVRFDLYPPGGDMEAIIKLAKAGFSHPRKQMHGNLTAAGYGEPAIVKSAIEAVGLDARVRAEIVSIEQWKRLHGILVSR